jgi:hypothetical protein
MRVVLSGFFSRIVDPILAVSYIQLRKNHPVPRRSDCSIVFCGRSTGSDVDAPAAVPQPAAESTSKVATVFAGDMETC